ncbi:MAG TPA: hypothetical protein PKA06_01665, partial [Gemmatales bacterium]|nr:hypothetical protein [Gemmatales bacterium]
MLAACGLGFLLWPAENTSSSGAFRCTLSHVQLPPTSEQNASATEANEFILPISSEAVEPVKTKRLVTKEIEKIRLGDVVVGHNPKIESERQEVPSSSGKEVYA